MYRRFGKYMECDNNDFFIIYVSGASAYLRNQHHRYFGKLYRTARFLNTFFCHCFVFMYIGIQLMSQVMATICSLIIILVVVNSNGIDNIVDMLSALT